MSEILYSSLFTEP